MNCTTCGEPYTKIPTERANYCSNSFHCCRECVWYDGKVVEARKDHESDHKTKDLQMKVLTTENIGETLRRLMYSQREQ